MTKLYVVPKTVTTSVPSGKCTCGGKIVCTSVWGVYWCEDCYNHFELMFVKRSEKSLTKRYGAINK